MDIGFTSSLKLHSCWFPRWPERWIRLLQWGSTLFWISMAGALIGFGTLGSNLYQQPAQDQFIEIFFTSPFLLLISLLIVWFIVSLKPNYSRMEEYKFLNSLPIQSRRVCTRFLFLDAVRFAWVPASSCVLLLGMLSVSPISYLFRLSLLTMLLYSLSVLASTILHLSTSMKRNRSGLYGYPARFNPMIQGSVILGFACLQLALIVVPNWSSGLRFWFLFLILILCNYLLIVVARILFKKWQTTNVGLQIIRKEKERVGFSYQILAPKVSTYLRPNPFLLKNIIEMVAGKTSVVNTILTLAFIVTAYLIAMNNDTMTDRIAVLLGISIIYAFFFAICSINRIAADREPPSSIYSLPVRKSHLYFSAFIPTMGWLVGVFTAMTFLLLISGSSVPAAGWYWLKSLFVSLILITIALNCAIRWYPDNKEAQKRYLYWIFFFITLMVVLYKYRIPIAVMTALFSMVPLRKMELYKI